MGHWIDHDMPFDGANSPKRQVSTDFLPHSTAVRGGEKAENNVVATSATTSSCI